MHVASCCLGPLATNCYLIERNGVRVLIDPAEPSPELEAWVGDRSIDAVVLSHGHFDHIGGAWCWEGVPVMMHAADLPFVDEAHPHHPPIDRTIDEGDEIVGGLHVLHTPGHSPGSLVLAVEDALFVGDLLFAGSIGRTDLPGGSPAAMEASLQRVAGLDGDRTVYPGHGGPTTLGRERATNPFLRSIR